MTADPGGGQLQPMTPSAARPRGHRCPWVFLRRTEARADVPWFWSPGPQHSEEEDGPAGGRTSLGHRATWVLLTSAGTSALAERLLLAPSKRDGARAHLTGSRTEAWAQDSPGAPQQARTTAAWLSPRQPRRPSRDDSPQQRARPAGETCSWPRPACGLAGLDSDSHRLLSAAVPLRGPESGLSSVDTGLACAQGHPTAGLGTELSFFLPAMAGT